MSVDTCRVCGSSFLKEPLLQYANMPQGAQSFLDKDSIKNDEGVDIDVCQCAGCGLVQLTNDPVSYCKDVIRAAAFSEEMREFRVKQFKGFVQKHSLHTKKILEVGCGRGEFLSLLGLMDVKAFGLEHSQESVDECVGKGLQVSPGYIENSTDTIDGAPFDAFMVLNFLEHIPQPNNFLKGICNNLADDAIGLAEVPNFDMIIRKSLFSEFVPDHLFYFTKQTLCLTLVINGFEVLECQEVWHDYILSALVKKRQTLDLSQFTQRQSQLIGEIEEYINRFDDEKVAVWGAGHQALAILALLKRGKKIKCIVDSAPFKQGMATPATHIPVVAPDTLNTDPVDVVIVMAASYTDEVAKIIREQHGDTMQIALLRDYGLEVIE